MWLECRSFHRRPQEFHCGKRNRAQGEAVFRAILALKERIEREVLPRFGPRRQHNAQTLMRHLYARPVVDVRQAVSLLGCTPNTASSLIADLATHGVLVEVTGQRRHRLFVFRDYVGLFRR